MSIPPEVKNAVRRQFNSTLNELDSRSIFDHRTNLQRAKITMLLAANKNVRKMLASQDRGPITTGGGGTSNFQHHLQQKRQQEQQQAQQQAQQQQQQQEGGGGGTSGEQQEKKKPATLVLASSSVLQSGTSKKRKMQLDDFLSKSRFGTELQSRFNQVDSAIPQIQQEDTIKSKFVSRNAKDAATASDPRVGTVVNSSNNDRKMSVAGSEGLAQQQQQQQIPQEQQQQQTFGRIGTSLDPIKPDGKNLSFLPPHPSTTSASSTSKQRKQEQQRKTSQDEEEDEEDKDEEDEEAEDEQEDGTTSSARRRQRRRRGGRDEEEEDEAARLAKIRRKEKRRLEKLMSNPRPVSPDDLQLQSTSGWVQRCMEKRDLEENDAEFTYRQRLKQRDERYRSPSPVKRYHGGNVKIPGSDSTLTMGVAGFFRPNTLTDQAGLQPASQEDVAMMSACDDRRHRMYLRQAKTLETERERMIGSTGVELFESAGRLMNKDWTFMNERNLHQRKGEPHQQQNEEGEDEDDDDNEQEEEEEMYDEHNMPISTSDRIRKLQERKDRNNKKNNNNNNNNKKKKSSSYNHRNFTMMVDSSEDDSNDDDDDNDDDNTTVTGTASSSGSRVTSANNNNSRNNNNNNNNNRPRRPGTGDTNRTTSSTARSQQGDEENDGREASSSSIVGAGTSEAIELLEAATVCACEMIAGTMNDVEHRNTDATVIKNILKRSLVTLIPKARRIIQKAKRSNSNQKIGQKRKNNNSNSLVTAASELNLLRSWIKGSEVWVACELGLDTHAGFFCVTDTQHLKEFCSLYARKKQIAERNTESLMRKWQQQRDIITDPSELIEMDPNQVIASALPSGFDNNLDEHSDDQDDQDDDDDDDDYDSNNNYKKKKKKKKNHRINNNNNLDDSNSETKPTVNLPDDVSNFLKAIRSGKTNIAESRDINAAARETTGKYFETLQRFGVLPMPAESSTASSSSSSSSSSKPNKNNNKPSRVSGASSRLKQMLQRFVGVNNNNDSNNPSSSATPSASYSPSPSPSTSFSTLHQENQKRQEREQQRREQRQQGLSSTTSTAMVNIFHPAWMRSVTGGGTPAEEVPERVATIDAQDTVMILELFVVMLSDVARRYVREEISNSMKYFHDTAPDREGVLVREDERKQKVALRSVHHQLLHQAAETAHVDNERLAKLRKAIDRTDAWVHVATVPRAVTPPRPPAADGDGADPSSTSEGGKEKEKQEKEDDSNKNKKEKKKGEEKEKAKEAPEEIPVHTGGIKPQRIGLAKGSESSASSSARGTGRSGGSGRNSAGEEETTEERSVGEERARAQALQRLAQLWKQLFVPFNYRMELLEKYRSLSGDRVVLAEQRYSECVNAVVKRESLLSQLNEFEPLARAADEKERNASREKEVPVTPFSVGTSYSSSSSSSSPTPSSHGRRSELESERHVDVQELKRQRQAKKQQLISDFTAASEACDASIEKLATIGEQLYFHNLIYSVKMKDDMLSLKKSKVIVGVF